MDQSARDVAKRGCRGWRCCRTKVMRGAQDTGRPHALQTPELPEHRLAAWLRGDVGIWAQGDSMPSRRPSSRSIAWLPG